MSILVDLHKAIAKRLEKFLPEGSPVIRLERRFDFEESGQQQFKAPAIFVAILGARPAVAAGPGVLPVLCLAVIATAATKNLSAGDAGVALAELVAQDVLSENFNVDGVAGGENVSWDNLSSRALSARGIVLHGVAWNHLVNLPEKVDEAKLDEFLRIFADYQTVESTKPSDATDTVTLPQS